MKARLTLVLMMAVWGFAQAGASPLGVESDSGIRGPAYQDLVAAFSELPKKYPDWVQVNTYGKTPEGRPLVLIRIALPQAYRERTQTRPAILITGSTHGDEYLNIEDRLPEWFLKVGMTDPAILPFFKAGGMLYLIPIFNPDGYDRRMRGNSRGKDLNRDFGSKAANVVGFKEVETQALRNMIVAQIQSSQQRLLLTMDYHCCIGAALYPWSFKPAPAIPAADEARMKAAGSVIQSVFGAKFPVGRTPDVLGYNALGTSKDFYYESFGAISFTYEGAYEVEARKFDQHTQMWKMLIRALAPAYR